MWLILHFADRVLTEAFHSPVKCRYLIQYQKKMLQWAVYKGRGAFTVLLSKLVSIVSLSVQWLLTYKSGCTVNYKILRTSMFIHTTSTICPINHSRLTIQMLSSVCVSASPVLMTQLILEASSPTDRIWVIWNWPRGNFFNAWLHAYFL